MIPLIPSSFPEEFQNLKDDATVQRKCHALFEKHYKGPITKALIGLLSSFFPELKSDDFIKDTSEIRQEARFLLYVCLVRLYINNNEFDKLPLADAGRLIYKTASNICITLVRKVSEGRKSEETNDLSEPKFLRISGDRYEWDHKEFKSHILEFIKTLPEKQFLVFLYKAIEGWSHKEIGEALEISEKNSKSTFSQVRRLVIKKFGDRYDDLFPDNNRIRG